MSESSNGVLWGVCDRNATQGPRVHQTPAGRNYPLTADFDRPTMMPRSDAAIFLRDPAFIVTDENGVVQRPLPSSEAKGERAVTDLEADECVARYDELTLTALRARAASRPGGAKVDGLSREQVIAFLVKGNPEAPTEARRPSAAAAKEEDSLIEDTDPEGDGGDGTGLPDREAALAGL